MTDDTGDDSSMKLTPEKQVEELLQSSLDPVLTAEYRSAVELIPETVRKETKIKDFLWIAEGDPVDAATRIASYWKRRKALFGERWLLPMTMTGTGALESKHIYLLRTGYLQMVKNETHGVVMVFDFKLLPPLVAQIQQEIHFYLFTVCAPSFVTVLFLIRCGGVPDLDLSQLQKGNMLQCTACKMKKFFIVQVFEDSGRQHLLDFLGYKQRRYAETVFQRPCSGHIAESSVGGTARLLHEYGLSQSCVPRELGGSLNRTSFDHWIRTRLSVEEIVGANLVTTGLARTSAEYALMVQKPSRRKRKTPRKQFQRSKERLDITRQPNETDQEFEKRKNACYARRNYHRKRMELFAAEGEIERYKVANKALREDNERLEGLLSTAKCLVEHAAEKPALPVAVAHDLEPSCFRWGFEMQE